VAQTNPTNCTRAPAVSRGSDNDDFTFPFGQHTVVWFSSRHPDVNHLSDLQGGEFKLKIKQTALHSDSQSEESKK